MNQTVAIVDEDIRRALNALSADVQASLALSRATLQVLAAASPALNAAAEQALDDEAEMARELAASERVVDAIEDARVRLPNAPAEAEMMTALERALVAAADALPDIHDLQSADIAALARG